MEHRTAQSSSFPADRQVCYHLLRGLPEGSPGTVHVPGHLEFDPQRGIGSEEQRKPDCSIGRDRSPAADQFIDPSSGNAHRARQCVLGDTSGLHEAGLEETTGMHGSPRASHQNGGATIGRRARGNRFHARTPRYGGSGGDTSTSDRLHRWNPGARRANRLQIRGSATEHGDDAYNSRAISDQIENFALSMRWKHAARSCRQRFYHLSRRAERSVSALASPI